LSYGRLVMLLFHFRTTLSKERRYAYSANSSLALKRNSLSEISHSK